MYFQILIYHRVKKKKRRAPLCQINIDPGSKLCFHYNYEKIKVQVQKNSLGYTLNPGTTSDLQSVSGNV